MFGSPASIVNTTSNKESIVATTSSSNYTGLYGANASPIVPTTAYGNADVVALLAASTDGANTIGNISATGNITGVYLFGNGSQLSGLGATYSNATVSSYLASGLNSANIITTANVTGGNLTTTGLGGSITGANLVTAATVSVSGNITANDFYGNGSGLTGITVGAGTQIINGTSNVSVALNGNTTIGVANVTQAQISSQGISVVGNITGSYFIGNGSQLTGLAAVSTANSATFLTSSTNAAAFVSIDSANTQTVLPGTGRIGYGGDGVDPNTFGSVDIIPAQTNLANAYASLTFVNLANFAANPINSVGVNANGARLSYDIYGSPKSLSLTSAGVTTDTTVSAAGTITGGNLATGGTASATGNITGGNISTGGLITATGNITGGNLTGVSGSVATGIINYKDYVATITYAATITPDIALGSIQQVTLTGNVTMNAFGGTPQAGQSMVIKFIQDATGGRLLSSTMKWAGGAKTLSPGGNAVDIASVFYDGTTYWASLTLAYA